MTEQMRVSVGQAAYVATFGTETNSFIDIPTTEKDFEDCCLFRRGQYSDPPNYLSQLQIFLAQLLQGSGFEVTHGLCAFGRVGGPVTTQAYTSLSEEIIAEVRATKPKVILMFVHGAMISETDRDAEGTFLSRLRSVCGPDTFIGCVLDLHVNLSDQMLAAADLLIGCKEYPHDDFAAAAQSLVTLALRAINGEMNLVTRTFDTRMIGLFSTKTEPMKAIVDAFRAEEEAGHALQVWAAHGFPFSDTEQTSYKIVVTTDGDGEAAAQLAERLGRRVIAARNALPAERHSVEAIASLPYISGRGPIVLGDIADNPMGGAPGDCTHLLRHLIYNIESPSALATVYDPEFVQLAKHVSAGDTFAGKLGGKVSDNSGTPISDTFKMLRFLENKTVSTPSGASELGDTCVVQVRDAVTIVASIPVQVFSSSYFTDCGLDLDDFRYVAVKSTQQFTSFFGAPASGFYFISTPGALSQDYASFSYTHLKTSSIWPFVEDPMAAPFF
ncbi:MAG: M81 family metallopeptidase [Pseudomonadota bacterium]